MNNVKEVYLLNVCYKYPYFQKRMSFILKIDHSYYRLTFFSGLNIKKLITTNMVKQILREHINHKIYLFSRPEDEDNKELDVKEIIPLVRMFQSVETDYSLRILLRK